MVLLPVFEYNIKAIFDICIFLWFFINNLMILRIILWHALVHMNKVRNIRSSYTCGVLIEIDVLEIGFTFLICFISHNAKFS